MHLIMVLLQRIELPNGLETGVATPGLFTHSEHAAPWIHQCALFGCSEFSCVFHYQDKTDLIRGLEIELSLQFPPLPQRLEVGAECQL